MSVIDSASCMNVYLLRFDAGAEAQLYDGEALLDQFNSTFDGCDQFDPTCVFLMFNLSNADIMSIGITHPCKNDVALFAKIEKETGLMMPPDLVITFLCMPDDDMFYNSCEYRDNAIIEFIKNAKDNKKMDSRSMTAGKNSRVFVLSKYPCLSSIARDPFAKTNSKVFKYDNKYYTMSSNFEFNLGKAPMSVAFLEEHGTNLGTVHVLQEVLR